MQKKNLPRFHRHMQYYLTPIKEQPMIIPHLLLHLELKAGLDRNKAINGKIQNSTQTLTTSLIWTPTNKRVNIKTLNLSSKVSTILSHLQICLSNLEHSHSKWLIKSSRMYFLKMKNSNKLC